MKYFIFLISLMTLTSCSGPVSNNLAQDAKDSGTLFAYQIDTPSKIYKIIGFGQTNKDGSFVVHDISDKVWTFPPGGVVEKQPATYEFYLSRTKPEK